MSTELSPEGPDSSRSFFLENDSKESVAIEMKITGRAIDLQGKETQPEVPDLDKTFLIYPPQLIIKAGERRTVRVSYIGNKTIKGEQAFRLIAEQLPVAGKSDSKTPDRGASINVLLKYVAALYVTPSGSKPKLTVTATVPNPPSKDHKMELTLANQGSAHLILRNIELKLKSGNKKANLALNDLKEVSGQNLLANATRKIMVPLPEPLKGSAKEPIEITYTIKE